MNGILPIIILSATNQHFGQLSQAVAARHLSHSIEGLSSIPRFVSLVRIILMCVRCLGMQSPAVQLCELTLPLLRLRLWQRYAGVVVNRALERC